MTFPDIMPELKTAMPELRGRLTANQRLAELTWFRVGGPAQMLFTPADENDLAYFLAHLPGADVAVYVLSGSAPSAARPPSTGSTAPEMKDASGASRNATA